MLSAAQLLDELMGRDRNLAPTDERPELKWDDPQVCKHYLVAFCPNDLFTNTKADLGTCGKLHDDALRKEYEGSSRRYKMGYEEEFVRYSQTIINEAERRINKGRMRLALNSHPPILSKNLPSNDDEEKVIVLTDKIEELLAEAEKLGCDGQVEESQGIMRLAEQLRQERDEMQKSNASTDQIVPILKEMEVCDICGAFLIVGDAKSRAEEHLMGKQHMGYAKIRITVTDFIEQKKLRETEREDRLMKEREEREKEREKEREDRKKMRDQREKEREKDRSGTSYWDSNSRNRDRDRDRKRRSKSRDHDRRDRDRDRRDRSRDRDHDRRDRRRSRSGERSSHRSSSHRSRSPDREGSRSNRSSSRRDEDRRSKDRSQKEENGERKSDDHHAAPAPSISEQPAAPGCD